MSKGFYSILHPTSNGPLRVSRHPTQGLSIPHCCTPLSWGKKGSVHMAQDARLRGDYECWFTSYGLQKKRCSRLYPLSSSPSLSSSMRRVYSTVSSLCPTDGHSDSPRDSMIEGNVNRLKGRCNWASMPFENSKRVGFDLPLLLLERRGHLKSGRKSES